MSFNIIVIILFNNIHILHGDSHNYEKLWLTKINAVFNPKKRSSSNRIGTNLC